MEFIVMYQYHSRQENYFISMEYVCTDSIGEALRKVDDILSEKMDRNGWSDYHITNINIVPELH